MKKWSRYPDNLVFAVCDRFVREGMKAQEVADDLSAALGTPLTREQVYPLVAEAVRRGFVRLCPPADQALALRIQDRFHQDGRRIEVVDTATPATLEHVTERAAETALGVIKEIAKKRNPVHIGLGAGWTTMKTAGRLANLLRNEPEVGEIILHALGSGFSLNEPATAPVAFFSFFHHLPNVKYRGLFASSYVETGGFEATKQMPGIREAFEHAGEIDVVITSLASADDDHGEFTRFMKEEGKEEGWFASLEKQGWVGDVQYLPYSDRGPIHAGIRAVTLVELSDLVRLAAQPDKAVILISGPCRSCGQDRAKALRPLLVEPSLAVWSHLVTDVATVLRVLGNAVSQPGAKPS